MEELIYQWDWERIDVYLTKYFSYSRNFFHHIFERWWITINQKFVKKSYQLKSGDQIMIDDLERYLSPIILEQAPKIDLEIKVQTKDYLVVFKPKSVLSHPNSVWDVSCPSVVGFLYHKFKDLPSVGNFIRAGLIHRLDKDTDGFMLIAKTEKWLDYFKGLFNMKSDAQTIQAKESVKLRKFYRAVVNITDKGREFLESIYWSLPFYIQELVKPKIPYYWEPKIWITKILWVWENNWNKVDLDIEILTWRTHQIRYHLSKYWLPIIWDKLYWLKENVDMSLSAYRLEFQDIDWKYVIVD